MKWVTDCFFDRLVCGRPYSYHFLPLFPRSRNLWKGSDTDCHFRSCRRMAGYYARATDSYQQLPKVFLYTNTLPVAYRTYSDGIENGSFLDVLELDAASNNGVDQVRALRDEAI